jgi:hypothetical protein
MLLGVPREVRLTSAKETFMLDCKAAGFSADTMRRYRDILSGFVNFTGDMLVRELGPDHVRMYIAELTDRAGHYEGEKFSSRSLMKHYVVVRMWVRWMYAQKIITERVTDDGSRLVYRRGFRRSCDSPGVGRDLFGHRSLDCNEMAGLLNLTEHVRYSFTGSHKEAWVADMFAHVDVIANAVEDYFPIVQVALEAVHTGDLC